MRRISIKNNTKEVELKFYSINFYCSQTNTNYLRSTVAYDLEEAIKNINNIEKKLSIFNYRMHQTKTLKQLQTLFRYATK